MHIFTPDIRKIHRRNYKQHLRQQSMGHLLQTVTPIDVQKAKLAHIIEQMNDLQKLICTLSSHGLDSDEIAYNLNISASKIHKHLKRIERELHRINRHIK